MCFTRKKKKKQDSSIESITGLRGVKESRDNRSILIVDKIAYKEYDISKLYCIDEARVPALDRIIFDILCHFILVTSVCDTVVRIFMSRRIFMIENREGKTRKRRRGVTDSDIHVPFATRVWSTFWNFATRAHSVTYRNWYYIYRGTSLQLPPANGETFPVSSIYNIFIFLLTRSRNIFTFTRYLRGARISGLCDTHDRRRIKTYN